MTCIHCRAGIAKKSEPTKNCNCGVSTVCAVHLWQRNHHVVDELNMRHLPLSPRTTGIVAAFSQRRRPRHLSLHNKGRDNNQTQELHLWESRRLDDRRNAGTYRCIISGTSTTIPEPVRSRCNTLSWEKGSPSTMVCSTKRSLTLFWEQTSKTSAA